MLKPISSHNITKNILQKKKDKNDLMINDFDNNNIDNNVINY
jgi:hypothetical protein